MFIINHKSLINYPERQTVTFVYPC